MAKESIQFISKIQKEENNRVSFGNSKGHNGINYKI